MPTIIPITDFSSQELDIYARLSENDLLCRHEPEKGIFIAESPNVIERALNAGYEPVSVLIETKELEKQLSINSVSPKSETEKSPNSAARIFTRPELETNTQPPTWEKDGIKQLHDLGFKTVAMALTNDSFSIDNPILQKEEKLAIVLGTEGDGLTASTIADCDYTVKIPMSHGVDSLNVAAASAVAFWELGK